MGAGSGPGAEGVGAPVQETGSAGKGCGAETTRDAVGEGGLEAVGDLERWVLEGVGV